MSSTALQTMPETRVAFSRDQIELLKDTVCRGANDDELKLFLEVCRIKGLDPFSKQIHAVRRWDATLKREAISFQVGIDGFRTLAESTGKYAGQDAPMWCGEDGKWVDVWLARTPPAAARVTVYRNDFAKPITRVALYREYVQTTKEGQPNSMWARMPANQLAKCAESLAMRAAFPQKLAGLHTHDEMGQADNNPPDPGALKKRPTAAARRAEPAPASAPAPAEIDVTPIREPEPEAPVPDEQAGPYRVPAEAELRNGLRKGLETLPLIAKAWSELEKDYAAVGASAALADIKQRFERTREGLRTPLSLRTAVIVAQRWRDDNLHLWLQQPGTEDSL